jgi:hypothetical protein
MIAKLTFFYRGIPFHKIINPPGLIERRQHFNRCLKLSLGEMKIKKKYLINALTDEYAFVRYRAEKTLGEI